MYICVNKSSTLLYWLTCNDLKLTQYILNNYLKNIVFQI